MQSPHYCKNSVWLSKPDKIKCSDTQPESKCSLAVVTLQRPDKSSIRRPFRK